MRHAGTLPTALLALLALSSCSGDADAPEAPKDPLARLESALAESDPIVRARGVADALADLEPQALPDARAAFDASALDGLDPEFVLFALWWGDFDPAAALAWTREDPRATSYAAIAAVHRSWAHHDPQAAWKSAMNQGQVATDAARTAVVNGWDESGQPGLVEHVEAQPTGYAQQLALKLLARRFVLSRGADEAIAWVESLPAGAFRAEAEIAVAAEAGWLEPAAVAKWADPRIRASARPTGLPMRIATRWVRLEDPADAMAWLATLPEGDDRDEGVIEAFRTWLATDSETALAWLGEQEFGGWLEPAHALHAQFISAEQPEQAQAILARLEGPGLRESFQVRLLRWWRNRDSEAAEAWMAQSGLPEDLLERARIAGEPRAPGRRRASGDAPGA